MKSIVPKRKKQERDLARRTDPFSALQREIDDLFNQFSGSFFDTPQWRGSPMESELPLMSAPSIDFTETDDSYELTADMPGVEEKDLDVSVDDEVLTIKAEKSHEDERKEKDYHIMERSSGSYQRTVPLPRDVDAEKIKAKFKNGVLSLSLPKNPELESNKRSIQIES